MIKRIKQVPFPLCDLLELIQEKKINLRPRAYQRGAAWRSRKIARFIQCILERGIGSIPLVVLREKKFTEPKSSTNVFEYEVVDGQQRLLAMFDFFYALDTSRVRLPAGTIYTDAKGSAIELGGFSGKRFSKKYTRIFEAIRGQEIHVMLVPSDMPDQEVAEYFTDLNAGEPMTAQELRNAIQTDFAEYIRETARFENHHPLFTQFKTANKKKREFDWDRDNYINVRSPYFKFNGSGMKMDEFLVQMAVWITGYDRGAALKFPARGNLDLIYKQPIEYGFTEASFPDAARKDIERRLTILYSILDETPGCDRRQATRGIMFNMFLVVDWLIRNHWPFRVDSPEAFVSWFFDIHASEMSAKDDPMTTYEAATRHPDPDQITFDRRMEPFLMNIPADESEIGITLLDAKRTDSSLRSRLYSKAKGMCQHSNHKMLSKDARLGHKKAWSKGGTTNEDNCVIICHNANIAQGTSDWENFRKGDPNGDACK